MIIGGPPWMTTGLTNLKIIIKKMRNIYIYDTIPDDPNSGGSAT